MNDELRRAIKIAQTAHDRNDGPADATAVSIGALIHAVTILAGERPASREEAVNVYGPQPSGNSGQLDEGLVERLAHKFLQPYRERIAELEKQLATLNDWAVICGGKAPTVGGETPGRAYLEWHKQEYARTMQYKPEDMDDYEALWRDMPGDDKREMEAGAVNVLRVFGPALTRRAVAEALGRVRDRIGNIETHFRGADGMRREHTTKGTIKDVQAIVDDELAKLSAEPNNVTTPKFFANENELRGSYFCTPSTMCACLHIGHNIEFDDIPRILKLDRNDVIEVRVVERAKR